MQINLSSNPILVEGIDTAAAMRRATAMAVEFAGVQLQSLCQNITNRKAASARLNELFALTLAAGPEQFGATAALFSLALEGVAMLPLQWSPPKGVATSVFPIKMPALFQTVNEFVISQRPRWLLHDRHLRILLATDCRISQQFDLHSFERLHNWLIENEPSEAKFSLSSAPYMLLRAIEMAEGSTLSRSLRHGYVIWRASKADKSMCFEEFMADPKNMEGRRVHGHERERIELQVHIERRRERENGRAAKSRANRPITSFMQNLLKLAEVKSTDGAEDYFAALAGGSSVKGFRPEFWLDDPVNYPGRDDVNITKLGEKWFVAFRAYLIHRQKDYETDNQVRGVLHLFADYLLLYLPWWMTLHPETTLPFPASPKQFLRYFFVDRTRFYTEKHERLGALPKTFNELLPLRRPTPNSRNVTRIILHKFFNFITTYFEDSADFVSREMQNPIRTDFDNEVSSRPTKTNKIPFAEDVFPFLVHYGQALEAFGEFLQQQAYDSNIFREIPNGPRDGYHTVEWGYVPVFWYRGRQYRVTWFPNIYLVAKRTLQANPESLAGIYVSGRKINTGKPRIVNLNFPHLTVVRLLTSMTETGLRAQSIQWLDRRTFDNLAPPLGQVTELYGDPMSQTYYPLYVNTDKAHHSWTNLVSWRVRRSMLSERYFQDSIVDKYVSQKVPYEDREHSRFPPVTSLFRTDRSAKPVSDATYSNRWIEFLYGFQAFYNGRDGVDKSGKADALVLLTVREDADEDASLSDLFLAIHTPHACRATYATLKDGDLEVSEIAAQIGHSNTTITNTYQVPQLKRLVSKLKDIDERTLSSAIHDPPANPTAYLHPENADSSVRQAFEKSREQAISDFGFVPGISFWSLSELDGDTSTLGLLRQSPASIIRWHSTHVCPVGNQCPREIIANVGGMNRCGICPLAAKCIDHLTAIEAKQNELQERIRTAGAKLRLLSERRAAQSDIDSLHREMQLDTKELLGWKLSAEILRARQEELGSANAGYHVDEPELVRKQLQLVTRNSSDSEFFLQRIADSNAYPSLESDQVRAKATRYTRLILARQGRLEEAAFLDVPAHTELSVFASFVKPYVEAKNWSLSDLASAIESLSSATALTSSADIPLLSRG